MKKLPYILPSFGAGCFGLLLGYLVANHQLNDAKVAEVELAMRVAREIGETYGFVDPAEHGRILGRIHLVKDIDFAVYEKNGTKTIRAYR